MWKIVQIVLFYYVACALSFDEIYIDLDASENMVEKGRTQYQLLRERGNLPRYGNCWKSAVEHLEEGCRNLSEEAQSDIALHITNCFLEMSGHQTYNCVLDKKPNLRGICINSMTDRAFNVYTEFYTHTQNMCWFLRGQIWQETMAENTFRVFKQLEYSAKNQENLLKTQKESLGIQEKMLEHGKFLGKVLEDLYITAEIHKELLRSLQSWLIGEISWFNTIVFYVSATILSLILTSTSRTSLSRFPVLFLLFLNCISERLICYIWVTYSSYLEVFTLYSNMNSNIWLCRYFFIILVFIILARQAYFYKDYPTENNKLLQIIYDQNCKILNILPRNKYGQPNFLKQWVGTVNENNSFQNVSDSLNYSNGDILNGYKTDCKETKSVVDNYELNTSSVLNTSFENNSNNKIHDTVSGGRKSFLVNKYPLVNGRSSEDNPLTPIDHLASDSLSNLLAKENSSTPKYSRPSSRPKLNPANERQMYYSRYNLRTRSVTPDCNKTNL